MRIVCDTGPVFHLIEASLLDLLPKAGEIHIPTIVDFELTDLLRQSWKKQKPQWITIDSLTPEENENVESLTLSGLLDPGEAGAILLAKRLKADWFLTDDTAARLFAGSMGLEVHGTLGVVLWAAAVGHLDYEASVKALERLSRTSLWISQDITMEARKALDKMFK
jgi:predicted nucleic acid-binding protein